MPDPTLSDADLCSITGYQRPAEQLLPKHIGGVVGHGFSFGLLELVE